MPDNQTNETLEARIAAAMDEVAGDTLDAEAQKVAAEIARKVNAGLLKNRDDALGRFVKLRDRFDERVETAVAEAVEKAQAEFEQQLTAKDQELTKVQDKLTKESKLQEIADRVRAAGGDPELLAHIVDGRTRVIEQDGKRVLEVVDPETGQPVMREDKDDLTEKVPVTLSDLIDELRTKHPRAFTAALRAAGSASANGDSGDGGASASRWGRVVSESEIASGKVSAIDVGDGLWREYDGR